MLRRNSSKKSDRRQLTTSVHTKHESIDSEVARQHAQVAATEAFARAQERSSDMGRPSGILRNNSAMACQCPQSSVQNEKSACSKPVLRRQHSVRFAGANAIPRRQSIGTRATQNQIVPKSSSTTLRPIARTIDAPMPAMYRPPSRSSSIGQTSNLRDDDTANSFTPDKYYIREDDMASAPSSYRRLRRSKSMFNPPGPTSLIYTTGTPDSPDRSVDRTPFSFSRTSQSQDIETPLRAHKSTGLLRFGREPIIPSNRERNDEAVQLARDRFFQDATKQRLREQPSFLFKSRVQRQSKSFKSTVRSSSGHGPNITSSNGDSKVKESVLRTKTRKASETLKRKFRRIFGRSRDESIAITPQQAEPHVHERWQSEVHEAFADTSRPDEASISRVTSGAPSIRLVPSSQQLISQTGSVRSARSDASDGTSLATSWNSTAVNTLSSEAARVYTQSQLNRLSIINENGTHVSSASFNRSGLPYQFPGNPVVRSSITSMPGAVDSARVYSVLMKHVEGNSPNARLAKTPRHAIQSPAPPNPIPPRTSSANGLKDRSPLSIRTVLPDDSCSGIDDDKTGNDSRDLHKHLWMRGDYLQAARGDKAFGLTGTDTYQWVTADPLREAQNRNEDDDVFSPYQDTGEAGTAFGVQQGPSATSLSSFHQPNAKTSLQTAPEDHVVLAQVQALQNEPVVFEHRIGLRESRSTFFGSTTYMGSRTTSPYRRVKAEHGKTGIDHADDSSIQPFLQSSQMTQQDSHSEKAYSESIYSRTTSGQTPPANSAISLLLSDDVPEMSFPPSTTGDAVILNTSTYQPRMRISSRRGVCSAGSAEWKNWMSSEVAKLERTKENRPASAAPSIYYPVPRVATVSKTHYARHVRENAQIAGDDAEAIAETVKSQSREAVQSMAQDQETSPPPKSILKKTATPTIPLPPPPPPPLPERCPLRTMQSRSSIKSVNAPTKSVSAFNSGLKVSSIRGKDFMNKGNSSTATLRSIRSLEAISKSSDRGENILKRHHNTPTSSVSRRISRPFNSLSSRSRTSARENYTPTLEAPDDLYGSEGAGLMGPRMMDPQMLGSKRMVEEFLSSRRKRMTGSEEVGPAFI